LGVVVGTAAATLEINELFDARRRERGARFVEPRRFPPTSPNLAPGQCAIAFGLRGISLAVGASPAAATEALLVAYDLLEAGDAESLLVIAAEQVGQVVIDVWTAAGWPLPRHGAAALVLAAGQGRSLDRDRLLEAHAKAVAGEGRLYPSDVGFPTLLSALEAALA
jgi:3-oxoacyl-[acyl-carrier-protein] synthase-1/3-oxoacyl-[acyl-carrier-protein] synthase II